MLKVVPLRYGTVFKKAFGDREVFCRFASDVLGVPIEVETVHQEYRYPEAVGPVRVEYDLFAEDVKHRVIVEIQHVRERDFFDRFLHYHAVGIVEQSTSHRQYRAAQTVFTLVVLTTEPRDHDLKFSVAVSDMDPVSEQGKRLGVYRHRLVFLNPKVINDQTPPGARAWMELIADSLDGQVDETHYEDDPPKMRVLDAITARTLTPEELAQVKDEAAWESTKQAERQEGREEGREEGALARSREILLMLARAAGIAFGEEELRRIAGCEETAVLDRWIARVPGAKGAGEVLD